MEGGHQGPALDEDQCVETIPKLFEHLSPASAVELAKRLEPYRLFFLEDVLPPEQIAW